MVGTNGLNPPNEDEGVVEALVVILAVGPDTTLPPNENPEGGAGMERAGRVGAEADDDEGAAGPAALLPESKSF